MKNILVIKSDENNAMIFSDALKSSKDYVDSLQIAKEKLQSSPETVLLFDIIVFVESHFDKDSIRLLNKLQKLKNMPVLVFTQTQDEIMLHDAINSGVSAYIVDGLKKERVRSLLQVACARFEQSLVTKVEIERNKQALVDRKRIDKAKGVLMSKRNMDEELAYKTLREMAMNQNKKIVDVADNIIQLIDIIK